MCVFHVNGFKYAARRIKNAKPTIIYMHREIMHCPKNYEIDHINHNTLDNTKCNLRIATKQQNQANQLKNRGKQSKYKGVFKSKKKWRARIRYKNTRINCGSFDSEAQAAMAYNTKAQELYGEYACLNII